MFNVLENIEVLQAVEEAISRSDWKGAALIVAAAILAGQAELAAYELRAQAWEEGGPQLLADLTQLTATVETWPIA